MTFRTNLEMERKDAIGNTCCAEQVFFFFSLCVCVWNSIDKLIRYQLLRKRLKQVGTLQHKSSITTPCVVNYFHCSRLKSTEKLEISSRQTINTLEHRLFHKSLLWCYYEENPKEMCARHQAFLLRQDSNPRPLFIKPKPRIKRSRCMFYQLGNHRTQWCNSENYM